MHFGMRDALFLTTESPLSLDISYCPFVKKTVTKVYPSFIIIQTDLCCVMVPLPPVTPTHVKYQWYPAHLISQTQPLK